MKKRSAFVLTAFFGLTAFSQDTLYTTKGKTINGRITEITQNEIKFKKASNPDGPVYVMEKSDIVLIHYKNGTKEVFENNGSTQQNGNSSASNNNQNNSPDPVYATRPNVNVVVGGYSGWGGLGWGWGGWGWNRPYYGGYNRWYGGGYGRGYYGGYHNGYCGNHYGGGGHFGGGGHYGHRGGGHR